MHVHPLIRWTGMAPIIQPLKNPYNRLGHTLTTLALSRANHDDDARYVLLCGRLTGVRMRNKVTLPSGYTHAVMYPTIQSFQVLGAKKPLTLVWPKNS